MYKKSVSQESKNVEVSHEQTSHFSTATNNFFRTRCIYNSYVQPAQVEAALARRLVKTDNSTKKMVVKSKVFKASAKGVDGVVDSQSESKCLNKVKRAENIVIS